MPEEEWGRCMLLLNAQTVASDATVWETLVAIVKNIELRDIIDMLMVIYLIYKALQLVRETRAMQLLKGLLLLVALYVVVNTLELGTMRYLMQMIFQFGVTALLIIFQPELRRMLETVGRAKLSNINVFNLGHVDDQARRMQWDSAISAICDAANSLSRTETGALMVIERTTKLGEIIKTGTVVDAVPSVELIGNLFFVNSPLHDGAMIIRDGKIYAAGCYLPLSENYEISRDLGTRHRAGLGMSENSDAIVIIVSEETGIISVAHNGVLTRNYTSETLSQLLRSELLPENKISDSEGKKAAFWKVKKP
mgnify:FL=1